jgi:hypothetical protein
MRLSLYRKKTATVILQLWPNLSQFSINLIIDAHMVTCSWPGWPYTDWDLVAKPSKTPRRLVQLGAALDREKLRIKPLKLKLILKSVFYEMVLIRDKWQWPFSKPKSVTDPKLYWDSKQL